MFVLMNNRPIESGYTSIEPIATHLNGDFFVGSLSCAECHSEIYESHLLTAHYNSSGEGNLDGISGSFNSGRNSLKLNDSVEFRMLVREDMPYQDIFLISKDSLLASLNMDMYIGSGTKGQTYLNWQENALFSIADFLFRSK